MKNLSFNNREEVEQYFFKDLEQISQEERHERLEYARDLIKLALEEEKKEAIQ